MTQRLAIIGDVGGHADELARALTGLGADTAGGTLPSGLFIVQVGDLVHRGPDSPGTVELVDRFITNNPGRWTQLAGNHDAHHVTARQMHWKEQLDPGTVRTLQRWWNDGTMVLAAAFNLAGTTIRLAGGERTVVGAGELLITHAGLTFGLWDDLGRPCSAFDTAACINEAGRTPGSVVWQICSMITRRINRHAGVVWAEAGWELTAGWIDADTAPPFSQAHGHTSLYDWGNGRWPGTPEPVRAATHVDSASRITRTVIGDRIIWGCDPAHGRYAAPRWAPLVVELAA